MAAARMTKKPTKATEVADVVTEAKSTETVENTEVSVRTDFTKLTAPKTVKIKLAKDHNCCIGGQRYYFKAGEVYDVPVNVKSVLSRGDLLRPYR